MVRALAAAMALALLAAPALVSVVVAEPEPTLEPFTLTVQGEAATGWLATPASGDPHTLVVVCHGHGQPASVHQERLLEAARRGAVAVAMDYRGPAEWNVQAGMEDTIAATEHLLATHPTVHRVILYGVSLGGEVSGMALMARPDLFDQWIAVEPLVNLVETWAEATVAGSLAGEPTAAQEIEDETGGKPWEVPQAYLDRSPALFTGPLGVQGAIVVHAFADGKVPYNQGREMAAALQAHSVPVELYSVLRRAPDQTDTSLFGVFGLPNPLDMAGHAWEGNAQHIVIRTADQALWNLLASDANGPVGYHEFLVDEELGTIPVV